MDWTTVAVASAGFVATVAAAVVSPWAARRASREDVYVEALTVLRAAMAEIQMLSTFPGSDVPDTHSAAELARVDALVGIRASTGAREKFRDAATTLDQFYAELFRVQATITASLPNGTPADRAALAGIADRFREQLEQLEAEMRG